MGRIIYLLLVCLLRKQNRTKLFPSLFSSNYSIRFLMVLPPMVVEKYVGPYCVRYFSCLDT